MILDIESESHGDISVKRTSANRSSTNLYNAHLKVNIHKVLLDEITSITSINRQKMPQNSKKLRFTIQEILDSNYTRLEIWLMDSRNYRLMIS